MLDSNTPQVFLNRHEDNTDVARLPPYYVTFYKIMSNQKGTVHARIGHEGPEGE